MRPLDELKADIEKAEKIISTKTGWPRAIMVNANLKPLEAELLQAITHDIPVGELESLCEAWREGRAVVLPCKVGDMVYVPKDEYKGKHVVSTKIVLGMIDHFTIGDTGIPLADICTENDWLIACEQSEYSLTREEAEAALKAVEKRV